MKTIDDLLDHAVTLPEEEFSVPLIYGTGGGIEGDVLIDIGAGAGTIEWEDVKDYYTRDSFVMYTDEKGAIAFDDAIKATI